MPKKVLKELNRQLKKTAHLPEEDRLYAGKSLRKLRKIRLKARLLALIRKYKNILVVTTDNIGSRQLQEVRKLLAGKAEILMGKNTILRKLLREEASANPKLNALIPCLTGNAGLVFVTEDGDLGKIVQLVGSKKVEAAAKVGQTAPSNVVIPPGPTGMDPGQTAFFQAVGIATKIARGAIEIISAVKFLAAGDRVSSSHVALLSKLNIKPFFYTIQCISVYEDGDVYEASVLALTEEDLMNKFLTAIANVAAISLATGYPTAASVGPSLRLGFKQLLAVTAMVDKFSFDWAKEVFGSDSSDSGSDSGSGSGSGSGSDSGSGSGSGSGSDSD